MFPTHPYCSVNTSLCNKDMLVLLYYYVQHEDVMIYVSRQITGQHLHSNSAVMSHSALGLATPMENFHSQKLLYSLFEANFIFNFGI